MCLYAAQFGNGFQFFVAGRIAWQGKYFIVFRHTLVLLYNLLGKIQQTDIRFGVGFLSSCDNPKVAVKESLQVVSG